MINFSADRRSGSHIGSSCHSCCCDTIKLRAGEINSMMINYAPWSLPIGGAGIVPTFDFSITENTSTCPTGEIDGFAPPENTNYTLDLTASSSLLIDLSTNEGPAGNDFNYQIVPLSGPSHGSIDQIAPVGGPEFSYTPTSGFTGYDYFSYEMTDAQGRSIIRNVRLSVGVHAQLHEAGRMSLLPFIDQSAVNTDSRNQTVQFPIRMPISARPCDTFRLTIKQPAKDCAGNVYDHISCYDISAADC